MTYYSCFDQKGQIIARCQTFQDIEVLRKMGRPIVKVKGKKPLLWSKKQQRATKF